MRTYLQASLEKVIEDWIEHHCDDEMWPDIHTSSDTAEQMATAAGTVIDAMESAQAKDRR